MSKPVVVGVGGIAISKKPEDVIKTYALGSCVALIIVAPKIPAAGLAHIALPDSTIGGDKGKNAPGYFADKAIPLMIEEFQNMGIKKNHEVIIKMAGGAAIMDPKGTFNIGKRNVLAIKKLLWKYKLGAIAQDVGKDYSRTVCINVDTGKVLVSSPGRGEWEL